jgi:hypothetical protein
MKVSYPQVKSISTGVGGFYLVRGLLAESPPTAAASLRLIAMRV